MPVEGRGLTSRTDAKDEDSNQRREDTWFTLLAHGHSKKHRGNRIEHQSGTLGRIGRGNAARVHEPGKGGSQAGNGKGAEPKSVHANSCETRGLDISPDRIKAAAVIGLFQRQPNHGQHGEGGNRERGQLESLKPEAVQGDAGTGQPPENSPGMSRPKIVRPSLT